MNQVEANDGPVIAEFRRCRTFDGRILTQLVEIRRFDTREFRFPGRNIRSRRQGQIAVREYFNARELVFGDAEINRPLLHDGSAIHRGVTQYMPMPVCELRLDADSTHQEFLDRFNVVLKAAHPGRGNDDIFRVPRRHDTVCDRRTQAGENRRTSARLGRVTVTHGGEKLFEHEYARRRAYRIDQLCILDQTR